MSFRPILSILCIPVNSRFGFFVFFVSFVETTLRGSA
jgi:hypothetical protein